MKTLLFFIALILISCGEYPQYRLAKGNCVPDSLKSQMREWITKTVAASNYHMAGGDYEDPEDVIRESERVANNIFSSPCDGLEREPCHQCMRDFIPISSFNEKEKKIYERLLLDSNNKK